MQTLKFLCHLYRDKRDNTKELVEITTADGTIEIKASPTSAKLIELAKKYEIPIVVVAVIPFLVLLLMGFCYCLLCLERCMCCKKAKAKEKSLTTPVLLLFFSGTMVSVAVYTVTSSRALDIAINELPGEVVKSLDYLTIYANITKKILDSLLSKDFDAFIQHMNTTAMRGECILEQVTIGNGRTESLKKTMDKFNEKRKETRESRNVLQSCTTGDLCGTKIEDVID
ncbi:hypothetical protein D918_03245 [Trichuris suis]|nr:hypothetical protein D918_03245 [Trichuris suis]